MATRMVASASTNVTAATASPAKNLERVFISED